MPSPVSDTNIAPSRWPVIALVAALIIASAVVILLALQVRQLRADQDWLVERASTPYLGMYVPRVPLVALDGSAHELGQPTGQYQVLYFFTTTCPHCRASTPLVKSIARQLDAASGGNARMLGIAFAEPTEARSYVDQHSLPFPVIASQDQRTSMLFRARKVPLLMVIGPDGRVRYSRTGALNSKEGVTGVLSAVRSEDPLGPEPTQEKKS